MVNEQELFSKIHIMPENLKSQIFDYVEFLFYKLQKEKKNIMSNNFGEQLEDFNE